MAKTPSMGGGVSTATLLLLPFDGGANLGNDLGTEAVRHDQQSGCDRESAFDGRGLWAEDLAVLSSPSNGGKAAVREPAERRTADERELRRQLLQTLYNVRRTQPHRPSLPLRVIPDLFGCSIDEAQFTLWYLRGKKFIEITDDGMVITVAGVDHVESNEFSLERPASLNPVSFILGTGGRVEGEESSL